MASISDLKHPSDGEVSATGQDSPSAAPRSPSCDSTTSDIMQLSASILENEAKTGAVDASPRTPRCKSPSHRDSSGSLSARTPSSTALDCPKVASVRKAKLSSASGLPDFDAENRINIQTSRLLSQEYPIPKDYDYTKSTELNYAVDITKYEPPYFRGRYAKYRETLDYSYHKYYSPTRLEFHDKLIDIFLDHTVEATSDCTTHKKLSNEGGENWLVFTSGPMGVGKGHVMRWLYHKNLFPLDSFWIIDPDFFRDLLPENRRLIELNPDSSGYLTQKEAGYLAEIVSLAALDEGKNILVDGSLRDAAWYSNYINSLHKVYSKLKIAIFSVTAEKDTIFKRVEEREVITGRRVPRQLIEDSITQIPEALETLSPLCNYVALFKNDENAEPALMYHSDHVSTNEEIAKKQSSDREICELSFYSQDWMPEFRAVWVQR